MFHNDWTLYQLAKERERDLLRQLEHEQLVRAARSPRKPRRRLAGVSNSLGQLLINLGRRLQAGDTTPSVATASCARSGTRA